MYIRDSKKLRRYWDNILSRVYLLAKTYNCLSTRIVPDAEIAPLVEMPFTLADFDSGRRYVSWFSGPKAQDLAMSLCIDDTGGAESTELKCLPGAGRGIHAFWGALWGPRFGGGAHQMALRTLELLDCGSFMVILNNIINPKELYSPSV